MDTVLFFDEADALFGKRSEVNNAHDRYANVEVGHLLQKMDEYEGMTILATNLIDNIDEAFNRRLHFVIEFAVPTASERAKIWELAFPKSAPLGTDLDIEFLSENLNLTGGTIKNISVHAAFFAAEEEQAISMRHIMRALKREYAKEGKSLMSSNLGPYAELCE